MRRRISLQRGPGTNFSFLFPLPFLFLTPSPNALHLVVFTSWLPVQRSPEERLPTATEPSGQWSVVKRVLMAGLLFSVLLGFSVLLVYIFRSCGPRKHDPGSAQPSQPFLIRGQPLPAQHPRGFVPWTYSPLTLPDPLLSPHFPTSSSPSAPGLGFLTGTLSPFLTGHSFI